MDDYVTRFKEFISRVRRIDFSNFFSFDVTSLECIILDIITYKSEVNDCDYVWVFEIVREVPVTAQAVSKNLRIMENKGFIKRFVNKDDRRMTGVRLLEEGKKVHRMAQSEIEDFVKNMEKCFDEEEKKTFLRLSEKFSKVFFENINLKIQQKNKMEDNKV